MSADRSNIRASDQDRERAADSIRQHFAAGRLDAEEFDARLTAAYGAKTHGDLAELQVDLPPLGGQLHAGRHGDAAIEARRTELWRRVLHRTGGALGLFVACTVLWSFTGAGSYWPKWVLVLALGSLARGAWQIYGPAPEHDKLEAELDRADKQRGSRGRLL